ncbi:ribosome-recycling factor, mitochondrial [Daktulosphaira vitifoliae]|uniref:ribosome-recycling factor, mitochondrial n=1 Tax=Daktulosphaira vitifoliae TaxID=58002 RepID=UPI0021AA70D6|nr:ribosome-recycling factor, mitochondrial [Daktulosphaira vitifoliae]
MYKIVRSLNNSLSTSFRPCHSFAYCVFRFQRNVKHLDFIQSKFFYTNYEYQPMYSTFLCVRSYAKSKDKKREKGQKNISIDENLLSQYLKYNSLKSEMEKAVSNLKNNYVKNLSLRSSTGALEALPVTFEDDEYALQDLAQIIRKNSKTIVLNMASFPLAIPAVLESLKNSGMNLNPQQDKTSIFIPIPKVTKEHRENLIKGSKALFVKCRDNIKDIQNKTIKILKDNNELSSDLVHNLQNQITILADNYILEAQRIMEEKQNELKGEN